VFILIKIRRNQLGTPEGAKSCQGGFKFLSYVQHIFPRARKKF